MKTENEVRQKIDELFARLDRVEERSFVIHGCGEAEEIRCNIDALLWVIGDQSGKAI